ncbi:MAG TPA: hypothetical protein VNL14_16860 [Candidatus Acidoferrales bacterium]|nr:hypothetical protein [Candidatus Acidoferrales bacterium]
MEWDLRARAEWLKARNASLLVGVVALGLCAVGAFFDARQFLHSYLIAFLLWLGVALGSLTIVMIHYLTGGAWGVVIRRMLESAARTLPLMAVLFAPIVVGSPEIYAWMAGAASHGSYLSAPFFFTRAAFYFACWLILVYLLNKWSLEHDRTGAPKPARNIRLLSAPGLGVYVLTVTFAAVDWVMSLEPDWYSTIYGVIFMGGQVLSAFAFVIIVAALLWRHKPAADVMRPEHFHDLGNLLLAFVMLWAYFAFSQYLIIWSGNLPEEISWYLRRLTGGWEWVGAALIGFHFFVPFLLLLSRATKRNPLVLAGVAALVLSMRWLDLLWFTAPAFRPAAIAVHWMDVTAPLGVGGIWFAAYIFNLQRRPLFPLHEPILKEARHGGA